MPAHSHYVFSSQNGAIAAAVFQAWRASGTESHQHIALPFGDHESDPEGGAAFDNPLAGVDVPKKVLIRIFAVSIGGSIASAFIFVVSILTPSFADGPGTKIIISLSLGGRFGPV